MAELSGVSHLHFNGPEAEGARQVILINRVLIETFWPFVKKSLAPATASEIDKQLLWLDDFLVTEKRKQNRTPKEHERYLVAWVAVLRDIPADITREAFAKWLEQDSPFYPTPGQIKKIAQMKADERRKLHYRAKKAFEYLMANPDAKPFVDGPKSKAMREKLAALSEGIAKEVTPIRHESNISKSKRKVKALNEIREMEDELIQKAEVSK